MVWEEETRSTTYPGYHSQKLTQKPHLRRPPFIPLLLACNARRNASSSKKHEYHEGPSRATSFEKYISLHIPWALPVYGNVEIGVL